MFQPGHCEEQPSFLPAEVAHARSHLVLRVDVHALADTLHAFDWHGTGQGAWALHYEVTLGTRGYPGAYEAPVHHVASSAEGAPRHGAHAHAVVAVCNPADGAVGWAFEGVLLDDLYVSSSHPSAAGQSAT